MKITRAFWRRVRKEYEGTGEFFLCHGSPLFEKHWESDKFRVAAKKKFKEFLKKNKVNKGFAEIFIDKELLFNSYNLFPLNTSFNSRQDVLKRFLSYASQ
jgi:hypothetical protein